MKKGLMALLPALLLTAACEEDHLGVTANSGGGETSGFSLLIVDDPARDPATGGGSASVIDGVFDGRVGVSLRNQVGTLIDLGSSENVEFVLQNGAAGERVFTTAEPPAGTYTGVEITLENASALIRAGSTIGGTVLENDRLLDLGSSGVVVLETSLQPTVVSDETRLGLIVDLNAEDWVTVDNIDARVVDETDLAATVSVTTE